MDIKTEDGERFAITITRNWRDELELWVKKKHTQNASVVANHLLEQLHKLHGDKVLTSFSTEDQKLAIETEWDRDTPLDPEEVATQAIINA